MNIRFQSVCATLILMLAVFGLTGCLLDKTPTPKTSTIPTWFAAVYASA